MGWMRIAPQNSNDFQYFLLLRKVVMGLNPVDLKADFSATSAEQAVWSRPVVEILPVEQTLNSGTGPIDTSPASQS